MGADQSQPARGPGGPFTHERLFEATKDTRYIMDRLLEYMTKKITVTDFMQLSRPDTCKKYALFMTNSIHRLFYELQIAPAASPHGVIYFRSLKELGEPSPQEEIERQSLCLTISYFYTRIFQIYGALALTLVDDIAYMGRTGVINAARGPTLAAPGYQPTTYYGGSCQSIGSAGQKKQQGGAAFHPTDNPGSFTFLERILDPLSYSAEHGGYKTRQLVLTGSGVYFMATITAHPTQDGIFRIYFNDQFAGKVLIRAKADGVKTDVTVANLWITPRGKTEADQRAIEVPSTVIATSFSVTYNTQTMQYRIGDSSVESFFSTFLSRLVPHVKRLYDAGTASSTSATTASVPSDSSETTVPDALRMARIQDNLRNKRPLGHCIARGMQLLRAMPFEDGSSVSYICKAKFLEVKSADGQTRLSRSGIPEPATTLDNSPGINALAMLFYDTVLVGNKQLGISDTAKQQYYDFIRLMALRFGDTAALDGKLPEVIVRDGVKAIRNRRDKELCDKLPASVPRDADVKVAAPIRPVVQQRVVELFQRQFVHAAECGRIFQTLFNLQRDPQTGAIQISLSAGLIRGGFTELNRINDVARKVLVKYYEDCETIYLQGMKTVIDAQIMVDAAQSQAQAQVVQGLQLPRPNVQGGPAVPLGPPVAPPVAAVGAPPFPGQRIVPGAKTPANAAAQVARTKQQEKNAQREALALAASQQVLAARAMNQRNKTLEAQTVEERKVAQALQRQGLNQGAILDTRRRSAMKRVQLPPA